MILVCKNVCAVLYSHVIDIIIIHPVCADSHVVHRTEIFFLNLHLISKTLTIPRFQVQKCFN